jgi:hypothetical protein
MPHSWRDQNGGHWLDRMAFVVQFDCCSVGTIQYDVNLGLVAVVMSLCVTTDRSQVDGSWEFITISKRAAGKTTRTRDRRNGVQINDGWFGGHRVGWSTCEQIHFKGSNPSLGVPFVGGNAVYPDWSQYAMRTTVRLPPSTKKELNCVGVKLFQEGENSLEH